MGSQRAVATLKTPSQMAGPVKVGVAAVQGAVSEHELALQGAAQALGMDIEVVSVRTKADFEATDALVIPGGESTTISKLFVREGLVPAVQKRVAEEDYPILGTCAGMILLAKEGDNQVTKTHTELLGVMDFAVDRNAFGRQRESFERGVRVELPGMAEEPLHAVFIRAPAATRLWGDAKAICRVDARVIGVQEGRRMAFSFHPELTDDTRVHQAFLRQLV